jgi:hypothetical protein
MFYQDGSGNEQRDPTTVGTLTRLDPKKARSNTRKDAVTRSEEGRLAGEAPVDRFDSLQPQA